MADFNGVTLPDLPNVDRRKYPYTTIVSFLNTELRTLVFSSRPAYVEYTVETAIYKIVYLAGTKRKAYNYLITEWSESGEDTLENDEYLGEGSTVLWSDYDVLNVNTGEVIHDYGIKKKYYSGALLPEIPEEIFAEYPYCAVVRQIETNNYMLAASKAAYKCLGDNEYKVVSTSDASQPTVYMLSNVTWNLFGPAGTSLFYTNMFEIVWTNTDIPNGSATATEIYKKASDPYTEDTEFAVMAKELLSIADAIRSKTGKTDSILTENMAREIEGISSGGIEGGYDVTFNDENNELLALYSIMQGHSINPPNYTCKAWKTEDGEAVTFPYTPTEDITLIADNNTYASQLYKFYGIDSAVYPYVYAFYNNGIYHVGFCKTKNSDHLLNAIYVEQGGGEVLSTPSDIATFIEALTKIIPSITDTAEVRKKWLTSGSAAYHYSNFTVGVSGTKLRLDK